MPWPVLVMMALILAMVWTPLILIKLGRSRFCPRWLINKPNKVGVLLPGWICWIKYTEN